MACTKSSIALIDFRLPRPVLQEYPFGKNVLEFSRCRESRVKLLEGDLYRMLRLRMVSTGGPSAETEDIRPCLEYRLDI